MSNRRAGLSLWISKQLLFSAMCICRIFYQLHYLFWQRCPHYKQFLVSEKCEGSMHLFESLFSILLQIAVPLSHLGGIPLGDNNDHSWGLTWGLQGESVQAARLLTAGRPASPCDVLIAGPPSLLSLLHAYSLPHVFYSRTPGTRQHLKWLNFMAKSIHSNIIASISGWSESVWICESAYHWQCQI